MRTAGERPAAATGRPIRPWLAVGVVVAAAVLAALPVPTSRYRSGELGVYLRAAERAVAGAEIYRSEDAKPFTYPPFFALPFLALLQLPEPARPAAWAFVNFALLGAVIGLAARRIAPALPARGTRASPPWLVFVLVLALLSGRHLLSPIEYQSHDLLVFVLVLLGLDAWVARRDLRAGAWLGLSAACKATPLLFLPVLVWQGRFRPAAALLGTAAAATFLPDLLTPRADGGAWVAAWYRTFVAKVPAGQPAAAEGAWQAWNHLNQSLAGTLYRLAVPVGGTAPESLDVSAWHPAPGTLRLVTLALQVAVLAVLLLATWRGHERGLEGVALDAHRLGQVGAVVAAMLLLSPMSSKQHFGVLLLPLAYCTADFLYRRRSPVVGGLLAVVLIGGSLTTKDLIGRDLGNLALAAGSLALCALAGLLATAWVLVDRSRAQRAPVVTAPRAAAAVRSG